MSVRDVPVLGTFTRSARPRYWVFDFQFFPEVQAGETLSSPSIAAVSGLTIGTPVVTSSAVNGVPLGKGVIVDIIAPTAGTYTLDCVVQFSGGGGETIRGQIVVE